MQRNSGFEAQNNEFVARSIRAWDDDHARRRRGHAKHSSRRRHQGAFSVVRQVYGLIILALLMGFAALPQIVPSFATLSGESGLASSEGARRTLSRSFPICGGGVRRNCVIDGYTFWLDGEKIRIADINAPEVSSPRCSAEAQLGARATRRLQGLLAAGAFEVEAGARDEDVYGRKLRTLRRNGQSLGAVMVSEGLAHDWLGNKRDWCA